MGLFNGKKKTVVASNAVNLISDETPDLVKQSISNSVIRGTDIRSDLTANWLNCTFMRSKQYYNHGKNNYVYGLPNGSTKTVKTRDYVVYTVLTDHLNKPIDLLSVYQDITVAEPFAHKYLHENFTFDYATQTVTETGKVFDYAEGLEDGKFRIFYEDGSTEDVTDSTFILDEDYVYVIYREQDTQEVIFWNYRVSTNEFPKIGLRNNTELNSPYYPIVPIRENNHNLFASQTGDFYRTAKNMMNTLQLNVDKIADAIHSSPDIDDVDHAYFLIGSDIADGSQVNLEYLYEYFTYLHITNVHTKSMYETANGVGNSSGNVITIKDAKYKTEVFYNYIDSGVGIGRIGAVGTFDRYTETTQTEEPEEESNPFAWANFYSEPEGSLIIRKQISPTQYAWIKIQGLKHVNHIYGRHTVDTTILEAFEDHPDGDKVSGNFIVPVCYEVARGMGIQKANRLMESSLKLVFNSYERVKIKWYQTTFFKFLIIIIAVVITAISYQPGALTQAVAGGAVTVGAITLPFILTDIVIAFAIKKGIDLIAERVAPEVAFAIAIIAAAYAAGSYLETGSVAGLPFAQEALYVATQIQSASTELAIEEIQTEQQEFMEYAEAKQKELDDMMDEIKPQKDLDPLDLFVSYGEPEYWQTPQDYYHQAVHAGNIGATTLESINGYVENTLTLPSLPNTLGVDINL